MMRSRTGKAAGFTLLEIMIVVSIISILAVVGIPNLRESQRMAQETAALETMRSIFGAQLQHHQKLGFYADSIDQLCAANLMTDRFKVGRTNAQGVQQKGSWEFCTTVPDPSTAGTTPQPAPEVNRTLRFRIAMQPVGTTTADRLKLGDQTYIMLESKKLYTHRYTQGCNLRHAYTTARSTADSAFGSTYPETEGSR